MNNTAEVRVTVRDGDNQTPVLLFEPAGYVGPGFPRGIFGVQLKPGTTKSQANEIAQQMNVVMESFRHWG